MGDSLKLARVKNIKIHTLTKSSNHSGVFEEEMFTEGEIVVIKHPEYIDFYIGYLDDEGCIDADSTEFNYHKDWLDFDYIKGTK
jgi:hypothetical protein